MAANQSPIAFTDKFGRVHIEPSVTGIMEVQTRETPRALVVNDLIMLAAYRSGVPGVLKRFSSISAVRNAHDPDGNGDVAVEMLGISWDPFGDDGVLGSADIATVRVDATATRAGKKLVSGASDVVQIYSADYGPHTNLNELKLTAGTVAGKKLIIRDKNNLNRIFEGDNLGPLFALEYTGDGGTCTATVRRSGGVITYTGTVADQDKIKVNGVTFEFESTGGVTGGNVSVTIGGNQDASFANLKTAIEANVAGVTVTHDTTADTLTISGPETGVLIEEVTDSTNHFSVSHTGNAAFLLTTLGGGAPTDGSTALSIPLSTASYKTLSLLAAFINQQNGYKATVAKGANAFLPSTQIDPATATNIKTAGGATLTGYAAAIADWVNSQTKGNYTATILGYGLEPDLVSTYSAFSGGSKPASVTITNYTDALEVVGAELEGGIIIVDTTDVTVMAAIQDFIAEKQAEGKWFRAVFGADSQTSLARDARVAKFGQIASSIDNSRCSLVCQRMGVFDTDGSIRYLSTLYLAAAVAGGMAGNLPYVNPLTNKRLRFVDVHENDRWTLEEREQLLQLGVLVIRREPTSRVVSLAVTTSQDPDKRMNRIRSERDTVDMVDANVRAAFLRYRGKWASVSVAATVTGVMSQVLNRFVSEGALSAGTSEEGQRVPAWEGMPVGPKGESWVIQGGVLKVNYRVFIPGELNHVSLHGRAEYQRISGSIGGSAVEISTTVPV